MKKVQGIDLKDVQAVYSGPEGVLWELVMGEQLHIGGLQSSMDLAQKADVGSGMSGVDLCCCSGAGMRFLVRFRNAAGMTGVDATEKMVELGRERCGAEGSDGKISFVLGNVCSTGLPGGQADFVWGEDAWCYVADKAALIAEAARLVKPGGKIAFTDWVEGAKLSDAEADRFLTFMKFPTLASIRDYSGMLIKNNCEVVRAEDTSRFAPYCELYINMLNMQLTYDALRIVGFDSAVLEWLAGEFGFVLELARAGKIAQGLIVAEKK